MTVNEALKRALTCLNTAPRFEVPALGDRVDSYKVASEIETVLRQLMCSHEPWEDSERQSCPKCGKVHDEPVILLRNVMPWGNEVSYLLESGAAKERLVYIGETEDSSIIDGDPIV